MKNWSHRTFTLLALIVVTAIGFTAQAQPLPLPREPKGVEPGEPLRIDLYSPINGAAASYGNKFVWENTVQPDSYVLKFVYSDGQKAKFAVSMANCVNGGNCTTKLEATGVLDQAEDGEAVQWQVIAKLDGVKSKSNPGEFLADTVNAPETLTPEDGDTMPGGYDLKWNASIANATYKVIVKNAATGDKVMKHTLTHEECGVVCEVSPHLDGELSAEIEYAWFVKVVGFNGDKAKSAKQTFEIGWAVAVE